VSFEVHNLKTFDEVQFIFSFVAHAFGVMSKNPLPKGL